MRIAAAHYCISYFTRREWEAGIRSFPSSCILFSITSLTECELQRFMNRLTKPAMTSSVLVQAPNCTLSCRVDSCRALPLPSCFLEVQCHPSQCPNHRKLSQCWEQPHPHPLPAFLTQSWANSRHQSWGKVQLSAQPHITLVLHVLVCTQRLCFRKLQPALSNLGSLVGLSTHPHSSGSLDVPCFHETRSWCPPKYPSSKQLAFLPASTP